MGGDIDADREIHPLRAPGFHLGESGVEHPVPNLRNQRIALDQRQKRTRQHQAVFGMLPADQRLGTNHLADYKNAVMGPQGAKAR